MNHQYTQAALISVISILMAGLIIILVAVIYSFTTMAYWHSQDDVVFRLAVFILPAVW